MNSSFTPAVLAAFNDAKAKGVPFAAHYRPPYSVREVSTAGRDVYGDFDLDFDPFQRDKNGCVLDYEEGHTRCAKLTKLFCVDFVQDGNRFGPFSDSREGAEKRAESLNVRHFTVAGMSENPAFPVLL